MMCGTPVLFTTILCSADMTSSMTPSMMCTTVISRLVMSCVWDCGFCVCRLISHGSPIGNSALEACVSFRNINYLNTHIKNTLVNRWFGDRWVITFESRSVVDKIAVYFELDFHRFRVIKIWPLIRLCCVFDITRNACSIGLLPNIGSMSVYRKIYV